MANTYVAIATVTVGSGGASSISFSSIPATYTDLLLKISARNTATANGLEISVAFNGVTTNRSARVLYGTGGAAGSATMTDIPTLGNGANDTANTFANSEVYIPNYAGSNNKSVSADGVNENNGTTAYQYLTAGLWSNTSAITSIQLTPNLAGNFVQYSTATLYGIKNS